LQDLALQHAAVIASRKGNTLTNRYTDLTGLLDENLKNHSNVSKSVILAYTLSQWYATKTTRGQAALRYLSCSQPFYAMHTVLRAMMNGASDVSALETVIPFDLGDDKDAERKSLHYLFSAIKVIFPAAFTRKPGVSSEVSDAKLSSNRSTIFSGRADRQNSMKLDQFVGGY
jgi:hypothetical protein